MKNITWRVSKIHCYHSTFYWWINTTGNMSTTCFHVCIPSTLWRHPSGLPLSGFGLLLSRVPPFGANTCRGFLLGQLALQDDQTTPNVHFWAAKLHTRTVQPQFHEDALERRKTSEHLSLFCTTLRLGATGVDLGLSLFRGCSHSKKKRWCFILNWLACLQARWEHTDRGSAHDAHARRILQRHSDSRFLSWARSGMNFPARPPWHKIKARAENSWEMENRQECGCPRVWGLTVVPVPSTSLLPNTTLWGPSCAGVPANDADTAHGVQVFSMCTIL